MGVLPLCAPMASFPVRKACEFCKQSATALRNGWQLQDGTFSHLCEQCFSLYERGTFCNIFHEQQDGWRNCVSCEEKFHCGCIMSCHLFEINDDASGICCKSCLCCEYLEVPSTGTSSPSNGGFSVQVVLGLPADGVASSDEAIDCTSEEEDNEAKAIPTLSASLEQTGNPGSPGTNSGVGPANLFSLIEESYFCPQVSSKSPQMKSETLRETAQKDVFDNSKVDTGALSE